jgi:hypothetical protein
LADLDKFVVPECNMMNMGTRSEMKSFLHSGVVSSWTFCH